MRISNSNFQLSTEDSQLCAYAQDSDIVTALSIIPRKPWEINRDKDVLHMRNKRLDENFPKYRRFCVIKC